MIFEVRVEGSFQNVRSVVAEQDFAVLLRCAACGTDHARYACVARKIEIACANCGAAMGAVAKAPRSAKMRCVDAVDGKTTWADVHVDGESDRGFCVSELATTDSDVVAVLGVEIAVVTKQNVLFRDVSVDESSWSGIFASNAEAHIDFFRVAIKRV